MSGYGYQAPSAPRGNMEYNNRMPPQQYQRPPNQPPMNQQPLMQQPSMGQPPMGAPMGQPMAQRPMNPHQPPHNYAPRDPNLPRGRGRPPMNAAPMGRPPQNGPPPRGYPPQGPPPQMGQMQQGPPPQMGQMSQGPPPSQGQYQRRPSQPNNQHPAPQYFASRSQPDISTQMSKMSMEDRQGPPIPPYAAQRQQQQPRGPPPQQFQPKPIRRQNTDPMAHNPMPLRRQQTEPVMQYANDYGATAVTNDSQLPSPVQSNGEMSSMSINRIPPSTTVGKIVAPAASEYRRNNVSPVDEDDDDDVLDMYMDEEQPRHSRESQPREYGYQSKPRSQQSNYSQPPYSPPPPQSHPPNHQQPHPAQAQRQYGDEYSGNYNYNQSASNGNGYPPSGNQPAPNGNGYPPNSNQQYYPPPPQQKYYQPPPQQQQPIEPKNISPVDAKPPPRRQYTSNSEIQSEGTAEAPKELTVESFQQLRSQARNMSHDPRVQLELAKALVEASQTLAIAYADPNTPAKSGHVDSKTEKKNREAWTSQAYKITKKLVAGQYPDAMFFLASSYSSGGLGLEVDYDKAYEWYNKAAKLDQAEAAYRVAVCNEIGAGTRRDINKALSWYKRAAQMGNVAAMYKLGMISLNGLLGQAKSFAEAVTWLERAAEKADSDNPHAIHELGLLYERVDNLDMSAVNNLGTAAVINRDEKKAFELFLRAAKLGYPPSQFRLGCSYEYGTLGCNIDPKRSIAWYSRAAEKGEPESELALSGWYLTGSEGILAQSDTEAYLWARKAAEKGLAKAEYALGYFTEVGIGVRPDSEEAKRWYYKAAAQKHPKAVQRLQELRAQDRQ